MQRTFFSLRESKNERKKKNRHKNATLNQIKLRWWWFRWWRVEKASLNIAAYFQAMET